MNICVFCRRVCVCVFFLCARVRVNALVNVCRPMCGMSVCMCTVVLISKTYVRVCVCVCVCVCAGVCKV